MLNASIDVRREDREAVFAVDPPQVGVEPHGRVQEQEAELGRHAAGGCEVVDGHHDGTRVERVDEHRGRADLGVGGAAEVRLFPGLAFGAEQEFRL